MRQFPAFFNLEGARIVVFGGGEEAARKLRLFTGSGAEVVLVGGLDDLALATEFTRGVKTLSRAEIPAALEGARLVIIAEENLGHRAAALAAVRARGIPVNVVDQPEDCDFTVPSILDRGEIVAAIGSGGAAPVLAKSIRAKLEALLPQRIGELAELARSLRGFVAEAIPDKTARRRYWERAFAGPAAEAAYPGDLERAEALLRQQARGTGRAHIEREGLQCTRAIGGAIHVRLHAVQAQVRVGPVQIDPRLTGRADTWRLEPGVHRDP